MPQQRVLLLQTLLNFPQVGSLMNLDSKWLRPVLLHLRPAKWASLLRFYATYGFLPCISETPAGGGRGPDVMHELYYRDVLQR